MPVVWSASLTDREMRLREVLVRVTYLPPTPHLHPAAKRKALPRSCCDLRCHVHLRGHRGQQHPQWGDVQVPGGARGPTAGEPARGDGSQRMETEAQGVGVGLVQGHQSQGTGGMAAFLLRSLGDRVGNSRPRAVWGASVQGAVGRAASGALSGASGGWGSSLRPVEGAGGAGRGMCGPERAEPGPVVASLGNTGSLPTVLLLPQVHAA